MCFDAISLRALCKLAQTGKIRAQTASFSLTSVAAGGPGKESRLAWLPFANCSKSPP